MASIERLAASRRRARRRAALAPALLLAAALAAWAEEPPLPEGLGEKPAAKMEEPSLPEGLGGTRKAEEPALPEGLGERPKPPAARPPSEKPLALPFDLSGFWELRGGIRTQRDRYEKDASLGETRLQLKADKAWGNLSLRLTGDLLYDLVANEPRVNLETGRGLFDLREAYVSLRPAPFMDLKIGRQVLTWGTGDLVFINDLFPKDWNAFFIGRDVEYLKAPSDAVKASFFSDAANLDLVYTPRFDADRYIDGRRLSYYNPMLGRWAGRDAVVDPDRPDRFGTDDEIAGRLYKTLGGWELAAYGYHGFWKSPAGYDPVRRTATFPELAVYGASARGPVGKGIAHLEGGYYDSLEDRRGTDPFVPNSQTRLLAGYEQELARDFTAGIQYYVEIMMHHGAYVQALPAGLPAADPARHTVTLRLTRLLMNQNLELSLFAFFSPTDSDAHLRPFARYKIDDHWSVEGGANVFFGNQPFTFLGQFERNSNLYLGLRYGF